MARLDEMNDPKKPNQLPPGTAKEVGTHDESDFNDADNDDDDDADDGMTDDADTSDFE
jgi:hypothetical protein